MDVLFAESEVFKEGFVRVWLINQTTTMVVVLSAVYVDPVNPLLFIKPMGLPMTQNHPASGSPQGMGMGGFQLDTWTPGYTGHSAVLRKCRRVRGIVRCASEGVSKITSNFRCGNWMGTQLTTMVVGCRIVFGRSGIGR